MESDCGESMLQDLMPSGLPQVPVNSTGVTKQEVGYEVIGEVNKDRVTAMIEVLYDSGRICLQDIWRWLQDSEGIQILYWFFGNTAQCSVG